MRTGRQARTCAPAMPSLANCSSPPKQGGQRELLLGVDDAFIKEGSSSRRVPRADVAEFCVQSLVVAGAANRAVDLVAREPGQGPPTTDFAALLQGCPADCSYEDMANVEAAA